MMDSFVVPDTFISEEVYGAYPAAVTVIAYGFPLPTEPIESEPKYVCPHSSATIVVSNAPRVRRTLAPESNVPSLARTSTSNEFVVCGVRYKREITVEPGATLTGCGAQDDAMLYPPETGTETV